MIIEVKTALEGCGDHCKEFAPVVSISTWEGDRVKRWYRCEHLPKYKALADTIKRQMADNVNDAIKNDPVAEFWEVDK